MSSFRVSIGGCIGRSGVVGLPISPLLFCGCILKQQPGRFCPAVALMRCLDLV